MIIEHRFIDVGINIKCIVSYNGTDVFCFNCATKYIETAETVYRKIIDRVNVLIFSSEMNMKAALTKAIEEDGDCHVENLKDYEGE